MTNENSSKVKIISFLGNLMSFFSGIITILSFYGYNSTKNITFIILGIIFLILTSTIIKYRIKIAKSLLVILLNNTVPASNIEIIKKEVIYTHVERYKFNFESSFSIKVTGDEPINCHEEKLKWSAGFISNIEPIKKNQEIRYNANSVSYNGIDKQEFSIVFPHQISKNNKEPYQTGFKINELNDDKKIAKPILQIGVYHITHNLLLKVYFQESLNPLELTGLKYAHYIDKSPYDCEELQKNYDEEKNMHYAEFHIKNPIYGGKYEITWSFNNN